MINPIKIANFYQNKIQNTQHCSFKAYADAYSANLNLGAYGIDSYVKTQKRKEQELPVDSTLGIYEKVSDSVLEHLELVNAEIEKSQYTYLPKKIAKNLKITAIKNEDAPIISIEINDKNKIHRAVVYYEDWIGKTASRKKGQIEECSKGMNDAKLERYLKIFLQNKKNPSPSARKPKAPAQKLSDAEKSIILDVILDNPKYGAPKIRRELLKEGVDVTINNISFLLAKKDLNVAKKREKYSHDYKTTNQLSGIYD